MNFEKKLVVLTGRTGKGTALIERNGMGTFITLNAFSLPDLPSGEYALGVKTGSAVFRREVGSLGRIKLRFSLPDGDYGAAHLVLFRTSDEEVVLYGTPSAHRLWDGNLMDGLRGNGLEKKKDVAATAHAAAQEEDFRYSERKIEDYFLEIDPSRYADGAIAEVNYFEYSKPDLPERRETAVSPSEMQRRYLDKRFGRRETAQSSRPDVSLFSSPAQAAENVPSSDGANGQAEKRQAAEEVPKIRNADKYTVEEAVSAVTTGAGFWASVRTQIETLFRDGERFAPLEYALPGTKWVKVNYDDGGRYYTVGLIGSAPDFIAYGVPGKYGDVPPMLDGADFVPLSPDDPAGDGFWVLFQSAETGKEIVKKP